MLWRKELGSGDCWLEFRKRGAEAMLRSPGEAALGSDGADGERAGGDFDLALAAEVEAGSFQPVAPEA